LLALNKLNQGSGSKRYNLGNGSGFSVIEVINAAKLITNKDFKVIHADRRIGDPATLVADSTLAKSDFGWTPKYADLKTILAHAWVWEKYLKEVGGS
jgi:UDP-glucose 4-epimerase